VLGANGDVGRPATLVGVREIHSQGGPRVRELRWNIEHITASNSAGDRGVPRERCQAVDLVLRADPKLEGNRKPRLEVTLVEEQKDGLIGTVR